MRDLLTLLGLFLTLCGAALLFVYGLPRKQVGNVVIFGDTALKHSAAPGERDVADAEWQPIADRFQRRAKRLNCTGFGLVAAGTALQMAALLLPSD
jgi:hypothetical protein